MPPSTGPTHGVHPAANANPNASEVRYRERIVVPKRNLWSDSRKGIWNNPVRYKPKKMTITPPIRESHCCTSYAACASAPFKSTPSIAKTTEKPSTKKKLFKNIAIREGFVVLEDVSPARYARNPGMIGKTQGERNDTTPATNATKIG